MATIIASYRYGSGGHLVLEHRCDARCHDGQPGARCTCVCGGQNHGRGLRYAIEHAADHWQAWAEACGAGALIRAGRRVTPIKQLELPIEPEQAELAL